MKTSDTSALEAARAEAKSPLGAAALHEGVEKPEAFMPPAAAAAAAAAAASPASDVPLASVTSHFPVR